MARIMVDETNFIVRTSGKRENSCYIDYQGVYKISEIAKLVGMEASVLREKYSANKALYDESLDVYYFESLDSAKKTISDILKDMKPDKKGRVICLTEAEIEYIRKALINEQSNTIHVKNSIKDTIFKKLNG